MTEYPLTLTVEYESNMSGRTFPEGWAVIRVAGMAVHCEPMYVRPAEGQEKELLESAAAYWLASLGKEAEK